jgi:hypothetical protein
MGALLGLIPLLTGLIPNMTALAASPMLGNVLGKAAEIADKIFGTHDPSELQRLMASDQARVEMFKAQLQAATQQEQAFLADIQSARNQTVALAQAGSVIAWGAPIFSIIVSIGFFSTLAFVAWSPIRLPEFQQNLIQTLLGALAAMFVQVGNYWLGSSRSSTVKDATIAAVSLQKSEGGNGDQKPAAPAPALPRPAPVAAPTGGKMFR